MSVGKLKALVCLFVGSLPAMAGVTVTTPTDGSSAGSPVHFTATSTSSCSKGVASMGVYTAPGVLATVQNGNKLDADVVMSKGTQYPVVQEWDNCGGASKVQIKVNVTSSSSPTGGKVFSNLQNSGGWTGYALLPPGFGICGSCNPGGSNVAWSWSQGLSSPSMDGISTKAAYNGGTTKWADILWNNHLIGDFSSQGLPDSSKTLVPSLHNFTYDVYFWIGNTSDSQALEFDINQFVGGNSYIWGHECRIEGGHEWDTWSNPGGHWVASGIPCNPKSNAWNHLTISVSRTPDNHLYFNTITLNDYTAGVGRTDTPTSSNWYGITINYQMDSDYYKTPYPVYLDKLTFTAQ